MLFVENFNTDPYCNHALEEWLMENYNEDCFMLWRNQKAILLGKNQNVYSELNYPYIKEQGIKIVRRITGGGAVFTDDGNIMFTIISCSGREDFADFRKFAEPVLSALQALGIPAEFTGRNDFVINGAKFCGNAQGLYNGKLLHHGTLMYSADIKEMAMALKVNDLKLQDKGVSSVKSRVTNIIEHMAQNMDIEEFRNYLFERIMKNSQNASILRLSEDDWADVRLKAAQKHASPEWIYGHNPPFNVQREAKFTGGIIQVSLSVVRGRIDNIKIYGDFFGNEDIKNIETALIGTLYEAQAIRNSLMKFSIGEYFGNITLDELVSAIVTYEKLAIKNKDL